MLPNWGFACCRQMRPSGGASCTGPGLMDCVELLSHAVRENRCLCQPITNHPHAPFSLNGQFVFDISYRGKTVQI